MKIQALICLTLLSIVSNEYTCESLNQLQEGQTITEMNQKETINLVKGCHWNPTPSEQNILIQELSQQNSVKNRLIAFQILGYRTQNLQTNITQEAQSHCLTLSNMIDPTGAIYSELLEKNIQKSSFKETSILLENLRMCRLMFNNVITDKTHWQRLYKAILINSQSIDDYQMGFFETKYSLQQLLAMVTKMEQMQSFVHSEVYSSQKYKYFNYIRQNSQYDTQISQSNDFLLLSHLIPSTAFILQKQVFIKEGSTNLHLNLIDINNQQLSADNIIIQGQIEVSNSIKTVKMKGDKNGKIIGQLANGLIKGVYHLTIQTGSVNQQVMLIVQSQIKIIKVSQSILDNQSPKLRQLQPANLNTIYTATQNSQIHLQVQLEEQDKPNQEIDNVQLVAAKLQHPTQHTSHMIRMRRDKSNLNVYNCILDLGDPQQIANVNAKYTLLILVGDIRIINQVKQKAMYIQITYKRSIDRIISDLEYKPLDEIIHVFQQSPKHPNKALTYGCLFVLLLVIICYMISMSRLGNCTRLQEMGMFTQLAFMGVLMTWVALLTVFWISINLMQFLYIACGLSVVTILIGDRALIKLNN